MINNVTNIGYCNVSLMRRAARKAGIKLAPTRPTPVIAEQEETDIM